ncbi:MAG: hypothetical protein HRU06_01020 [Oceanospirillaceae bacterium]|nr:hypothetical protein [Oceanospirillaceae bacterium]
MNDFTLDELTVMVDIFTRAKLASNEALALDLQGRVQQALDARRELEDLDFEDCLSCKL